MTVPCPPEMNLLRYLRSVVAPTDSVLDIGCGEKRYKNLGVSSYFGVDSWEAVGPDLLLDLAVADLPFEAKSFDTVLMLDFLEHVEKQRGFELLQQAQQIARKQIIVLTPCSWDENVSAFVDKDCIHCGNENVLHKSLWVLSDFSGPGWQERVFLKNGLRVCEVTRSNMLFKWVKQ
jgi:hypothetical protein